MIDDVLGKLVADKYRIESLIREGESGDLYSARHEILDKPVTIKILPSALAIDERWVGRFVAEARAASAVTHPNILNLTDFGTDAKSLSYAVFEPADGRTLRDVVASEPAFNETRALDISKQIAAAVLAGHTKKIIHGGLSPKNVFVNDDDGNDVVKVYGFGADAMKVERDADPQYLSPEQCTAFPAADERSDIYALGIMLYEMLSGAVPFDGATAADVSAKQTSEPPPPLSAFRRDLHPEIEPIVLSAIAVEPDRRYLTMEAFAEDLEILSGRLGAPSKAAAAAAGDARKRNIWQTAFIALAGISLLAAALIYATTGKQTDPTTQMQADAGGLPVQPIGPATGALEDNLAKQGPLTEAEMLMANSNTAFQMDVLPGGDGYNAWASGGVPPIGAPMLPQQNLPLGGGTITIPGDTAPASGGVYYDSENNRCFEGGVIVRCPWEAKQIGKPETDASILKPAANANIKSTPNPTPTPKPMATPPPKTKQATGRPDKNRPVAPANTKPAKTGKSTDSE